MSWRERDFFEAWPPLTLSALGPIGAPPVFLLRAILHDWTDEDCKRQVWLSLPQPCLPLIS